MRVVPIPGLELKSKHTKNKDGSNDSSSTWYSEGTSSIGSETSE